MNIKKCKLCFVLLALQLTLANPASKYCIEVGGTLKMAKHKDGGVYGICVFQDGRECEEWALFRGECPVGGLDPNKKPPSEEGGSYKP